MRKELLCLILLTGCLFSCSLKRTDSLNTFEDILIKSKTYHKQLTVIVTDGTPLKLKNNSDKIVVDCIYNIGCGIGTMRLCEKGVSCMPVQHCGFIPNHSDCTGRCM